MDVCIYDNQSISWVQRNNRVEAVVVDNLADTWCGYPGSGFGFQCLWKDTLETL